MNTYQKEHFDTFRLVLDYLVGSPPAERRHLRDLSARYVDFRNRSGHYQRTHVAEFCTSKCYSTRMSLCCSRDSIVVYFADVVINCLHSGSSEIQSMIHLLRHSNQGQRCVYLSPEGCRWRISPVVCGMFLCDEAIACITAAGEPTAKQWRAFEEERRRYTWPDRPVVFDALEQWFLERGHSSPLMHLNTSPGLLALKRKSGLLK